MKQILLSILQDKTTTIDQFRQASEKLGLILAAEVAQHLEKKDFLLETPLASTQGCTFKNDIVIVPILRAGMALLAPFLTFFPKAKVGFIGLKRNEKTAIASLYYCNLPPLDNSDVILLDPMIATGGSAVDALKILKEKGAHEKKIFFTAVVAAQEGLNRVKKEFPGIKIFVPLINKELNAKKYIVPGLGDFGDRFFGT